jgi:hypothetical protein
MTDAPRGLAQLIGRVRRITQDQPGCPGPLTDLWRDFPPLVPGVLHVEGITAGAESGAKSVTPATQILTAASSRLCLHRLRDCRKLRAVVAGRPVLACHRCARRPHLRQATQPAAWSEATIRQPGGACRQLACAVRPGSHCISTTVALAGGALVAGLKNSSCAQ